MRCSQRCARCPGSGSLALLALRLRCHLLYARAQALQRGKLLRNGMRASVHAAEAQVRSQQHCRGRGQAAMQARAAQRILRCRQRGQPWQHWLQRALQRRQRRLNASQRGIHGGAICTTFHLMRRENSLQVCTVRERQTQKIWMDYFV